MDHTFIKKAKLVIYSTEKVNNNSELIKAKSKQIKKPKMREKGKTINFWSFILVSEWESIMASPEYAQKEHDVGSLRHAPDTRREPGH